MALTALVFVSALALCHAFHLPHLGSDLPLKSGACSDIQSSVQFQPQKFFTGKWYVNNTLGDLFFQTTANCLTSEMKMVSESEAAILHYDFVPYIQQYMSFVGKADLRHVQTMGTSIPVNYELGSGLLSLKIPITVVDTDYDNWAMLYFCKPVFGMKAEMAWAVTRERGTPGFGAELAAAAKAAKLDLAKFTVVDNSNCRRGEPSL